MDYYALIKKRDKNIIIWICVLFGMLIPVVAGGVTLENKPVLGAVLLILGVAGMVLSIVVMLVIGLKLNPKISSMKAKMDMSNLTTKQGKNIFKTTSDENIEFNTGYFILNGKINNYVDYQIYAGFRMFKGLIPVLCFMKDKTIMMVDIDGDLLDIIDNCEINVVNKLDLYYYLDNIEMCNKISNRAYSFRPSIFIPMEYKKNKEDAKRFNKRRIISVVSLIVSLVLIIGFNALLIWLTNSESGVNFSRLIGIDLIIKVGFSIGLLFLAFYKAKKVKPYAKCAVILYLISYWIYLFFLDQRINVLLTIIFLGVFIYCGVKDSNLKIKPPKFSRFFILPVFLFMLLMFTILDITHVNDGITFLVAAIMMGVIAIVAHAWMFIFFKTAKGKKLEKKEKLGYYICVPMYSIMFGFLLSWILVCNLNYALDFSQPTELKCEIVSKRQGSDNESDKVYVMIEDKEIGISVSDEEYFDLEVGDDIVVSLYKGAFNIAYYIYE